MRSGRRSLTLVTGPSTTPVTRPEVTNFLKIDTTDEDDLIDGLIDAATTAAEQYMRRALITQTWKLTLDLAPSNMNSWLGDGVHDLPVTALYGGLPSQIKLPREPLQSVTSVKTYDLTNAVSTFANTNYMVDTAGGRMVLNYGAIWPVNLRQIASCEITYVAGYGDAAENVPAPIRKGILMHIATMYEERGQCDTIDLPPGAKQLFNQYRVMGDALA